MRLKSLEIAGFKSFAKKSTLTFEAPITAVVGPNGSGKSNVAESFRFVLGEQSIKNMRGKRGEDLIFNGDTKAGRQNKARVSLVLDNADKALSVDFDEVKIERVVHRDGVNDYFINGSSVRLKDVTELLSGGNIGATGHHIISQGEADRILNSSPKDRRAMLEDALGLRTYQFKKIESEKKLIKTLENCKDVQLQRKEIAPHLKFLKKQVEKVARVKELQTSLTKEYQDYLAYEKRYLTHTEEQLLTQKQTLSDKKHELEIAVAKESENSSSDSLENELQTIAKEVQEKESHVRSLQQEKNQVMREVGSLDGEIRSNERMLQQQKQVPETKVITSVPVDDVKKLHSFLQENNIQQQTSLDELKSVFKQIETRISQLIETPKQPEQTSQDTSQFDIQINEISTKRDALLATIQSLEVKEIEAGKTVREMQQKEQDARRRHMESERELFSLKNELQDVERQLHTAEQKKQTLQRDKEMFEQEITEGIVLVGREAVHYESSSVDSAVVLQESRDQQFVRKRSLEKQKIRLEEMGGAGTSSEIIKEHVEVSERDEFLRTELEDLEKAMSGLEVLIKDLDEEINTRFMNGIEKINDKFKVFFGAMFDGGEASLIKTIIKKRISEEEAMSEEEAEQEIGVDISVSLPRKKTSGLMMLSGGERALTSIALIFAMSAVNPPPFIILDETDAALDEANSRKYGDMVASLAKHSQLILITHNRETMSRASTIYGVTMMQGMSELLSIKFEDGVKFAK